MGEDFGSVNSSSSTLSSGSGGMLGAEAAGEEGMAVMGVLEWVEFRVEMEMVVVVEMEVRWVGVVGVVGGDGSGVGVIVLLEGSESDAL